MVYLGYKARWCLNSISMFAKTLLSLSLSDCYIRSVDQWKSLSHGLVLCGANSSEYADRLTITRLGMKLENNIFFTSCL